MDQIKWHVPCVITVGWSCHTDGVVTPPVKHRWSAEATQHPGAVQQRILQPLISSFFLFFFFCDLHRRRHSDTPPEGAWPAPLLRRSAGTRLWRQQDGVGGGSWDAESAAAQPAERGGDPRDGGAVAAAHAQSAAAQRAQEWWGVAAAAAEAAEQTNQNIPRLRKAAVLTTHWGKKTKHPGYYIWSCVGIKWEDASLITGPTVWQKIFV